MTDYRRDFIAGASFFFTVNLAERRLRLLTEHTNPVKHGLVPRVRDWPHSSFHRMVKLGVYP